MVNLDSLNLVFIKRFRLLEPVFWPDELVGGFADKISGKPSFKFLSNPEEINQMINKNKRFKLKNNWICKPIKNLNIPQDNFWRPFKYQTEPISLTSRKRLPFYPFQIIPEDEIEINKNSLEKTLVSKIIDYKVNFQVRIYPPGAGTVLFYLYLEADKFNLDTINNIIDARNILVRYRDKEINLHRFFNSVINSIVNEVVKVNSTREVEGIYTIINFQGSELNIDENLMQLSRILTGKPNPTNEEIEEEKNKLVKYKLGRYEEDLNAVSKRLSIISIDQGLKENLRQSFTKGRRCFRNHFINALELAYVTDLLIKEYNKNFNKILEELDTLQTDRSLHAKVNQLFTANILDPCAYSTLRYTILKVPDNLDELNNKLYKAVYCQAIREFETSREFETNLKITGELFNTAKNWNIQAEMMKKIYDEIKDWTDKIMPLLKQK